MKTVAQLSIDQLMCFMCRCWSIKLCISTFWFINFTTTSTSTSSISIRRDWFVETASFAAQTQTRNQQTNGTLSSQEHWANKRKFLIDLPSSFIRQQRQSAVLFLAFISSFLFSFLVVVVAANDHCVCWWVSIEIYFDSRLICLMEQFALSFCLSVYLHSSHTQGHIDKQWYYYFYCWWWCYPQREVVENGQKLEWTVKLD